MATFDEKSIFERRETIEEDLQDEKADLDETEEVKYYEKSTNNIIIFDNILLNKYYQKIKAGCTKRPFSKEDNIKYRFRPEALASDEYGIPGLWYLILKVNSCEDFSEFHDFDYVLLPRLEDINECLTNEEYILKKQK